MQLVFNGSGTCNMICRNRPISISCKETVRNINFTLHRIRYCPEFVLGLTDGRYFTVLTVWQRPVRSQCSCSAAVEHVTWSTEIIQFQSAWNKNYSETVFIYKEKLNIYFLFTKKPDFVPKESMHSFPLMLVAAGKW